MKLLLILLLSLSLTSPEWLGDFDMAKRKATTENKMILLNFSGSDWCMPCIKMKKSVFDTDLFMAYAERDLVLLRADFPRQKKNKLTQEQVTHNERLAETYNPQGKFPFTLLLDANGAVMKEWDGYTNQSPENFVSQLQEVIRK
jgi:thioredoxin-related protein